MNGWVRLQEGNRRFAAGVSTARRGADRRSELTAGQEPFAVVLGCSDSRVPVELLFDEGFGDLFVVRTAGHTLDAAVLGSLEYGAGVLGASTLVVLGHGSCGAVVAAIGVADGGQAPGGHVRAVAEQIATGIPAARAAGADTVDDLVDAHAARTLDQVRALSDVVREAEFHGRLSARAARYDLASGLVHAVTGRVAAAPAVGVPARA